MENINDEASNKQLILANIPAWYSGKRKETGNEDIIIIIPPEAKDIKLGKKTSKCFESAYAKPSNPMNTKTLLNIMVYLGPNLSKNIPAGKLKNERIKQARVKHKLKRSCCAIHGLGSPGLHNSSYTPSFSNINNKGA